MLNEWLKHNYEPLLEIAKNISGNDPLSSDLLHYVIMELYKKQEKMDNLEESSLLYYTIASLNNTWKGRKSRFRLLYKNNEDIDTLPDIIVDDQSEDILEEILKELQNIYWYDRELFKLHFLKGEKINEIANSTGIPRRSISESIKKVKDHLKNKFK